MDKKSLIKADTLINKIRRKIFEIVNKLSRKSKKIEYNNEVKEEKQVNKQKIFDLYKKAKNEEVNLDNISTSDLQMLVKLANEEVAILKHRYENEMTQQKINERDIKFYRQKLEKLKAVQ